MIITLAYARTGLRMTGVNAITDADLTALINEAAPVMEDIVGSIESTVRVESYNGGHSQICLLRPPVISVQGIIESSGTGYQRTLTVQDPFAVGTADAYGYTLDAAAGILTRRASGVATSFMSGVRNIQVSYTSGRTVVPGNILRAYRLLIRHMWQLEQNRVPLVNGQPDVMGYTPSGFAVPNAVIELCGGDVRIPGIG